MTREESLRLPLGLYRLHLIDGGGTILAAVGENDYGDRWMAPVNWVVVPSYGWRRVARAEPIVLYRDERII